MMGAGLGRMVMLVGIPVYEQVDLLDVAGPVEMFRWADMDVMLVAGKRGRIGTRGGVALQIDHAFTDKDVPQFDVLWTPGGDPDALWTLMYGPDRAYMDFLNKQAAHAQYVCSVCEGALLLAEAGLLDGYTITTHWAFVPCFDLFPKVKVAPGHPRFCVDRNRVTGGGISSGLDEALELIQILKGTAVAQSVQQNTQYYPNPPVSSTIPPATTCFVKPPPGRRSGR